MAFMEIELKLRLVNPDDLAKLLSHSQLSALSGGQPPICHRLETTYFDTPSLSLLRDHLSFRLRREETSWVATVKADGDGDGGLHQREEYNLTYHENAASITPFCATAIGPRLTAALGEEALQPIFTTNFDRYLFQLTLPEDTLVELAVDQGEIQAGTQRLPFAEVELELKQGDVRQLLQLGSQLADTVPLFPEADSKWDRGARLAALNVPPAARAGKRLKKAAFSQDARLALSKLAIEQIHRVIDSQQKFLDCPEAPESVHQLRISLRRLRALLSFCKPLLPPATFATCQESLRDWGKTLEALRATDVLLATWAQLIPHHPPAPGGPRATLVEILQQSRPQLLAPLLAAMSLGQYTPLLLNLWSHMAEWPLADTPPVPPLADYLDHRLIRWLQHLRSAGAHLDFSDPQTVHQLRIQGKKLRYVLEIMAPSLGTRRSRLVNERLKRLQDHLGNVHDALTLPTLLAQLVKPSSPRLLHYDHGLLTGWQSSQSAIAQETFRKDWRKFKKAASAWLDRHVQHSEDH